MGDVSLIYQKQNTMSQVHFTVTRANAHWLLDKLDSLSIKPIPFKPPAGTKPFDYIVVEMHFFAVILFLQSLIDETKLIKISILP